MTKKIVAKKLELRKETLRTLDQGKLSAVRGAAQSAAITMICGPTLSCGCTTSTCDDDDIMPPSGH